MVLGIELTDWNGKRLLKSGDWRGNETYSDSEIELQKNERIIGFKSRKFYSEGNYL